MLNFLMGELGNPERFTCVEAHASSIILKTLAVGPDETLIRESKNLNKTARQRLALSDTCRKNQLLVMRLQN